jgi:hypothetical protein
MIIKLKISDLTFDIFEIKFFIMTIAIYLTLSGLETSKASLARDAMNFFYKATFINDQL